MGVLVAQRRHCKIRAPTWRMFRNHSAGWVSDRWPPFCRKLLAGLALIASGTLFVEFVEPFPDTWSSSWKQIGASIPVLTQDWDTNGSMKSFISRSIEWTQQNDRILILIYSYSLSSIFRAKICIFIMFYLFFEAFPGGSSHSVLQLVIPESSVDWSEESQHLASWMQPGALELGIKTWVAWVPKKRHFPMVQKGRKYLGISINWNDHYLPSISLNLKD